jgi:hypothetical protein
MLADVLPVVSEPLLAISGNIRQTVALLEVLVATKMRQVTGSEQEQF